MAINPIISIFSVIAKNINRESQPKKFTYNQQREMINRIFRNNKENDCGTIMLRLIVIDSLYSTNAMYSYFAIEDMANKLMYIGNDDTTADYFYSLATNTNKEDTQKLFSQKYGIRKNLSEGSLQTSLMSKYAYYLLLQNKDKYPLGFPIYDSLAIKMYPKVCEKLNIKKDDKIKISSSNISIETYLSALNHLRDSLFGRSSELFEGLQQFDILDAYLWRMGKIGEGNFSLLLEKDDYTKFISNLELNIKDQDKNSQEYAKRICEKYAQNEKLQSKINRPVNNKNTDKYKFDFNALVKYEIEKNKDEDIVNELSNKDYILTLINHWKTFYDKQ